MAIFNKFYPKDYYEKGIPEDIKEKAGATCVVCAVGQKFLNTSGPSLNVKTSGFYYKTDDPRYPDGGDGTLCKDIAEEAAVWMTGTAFAIGPNQFITAGHVAEDVLAEVDAPKTDASKLKLMAGFYRKSSPSSAFSYTMLDVTKIEYHANKDICFITTKQSVKTYYDVASKSEQRAMQVGNPLYMMGYPLGQAMKFSEGLVASTDGTLDDFNGYISFFPGNSGSPVLDKTGKVVGILVSGSSSIVDFAYNGDCYAYKTYANTDGVHAGIIYAENLRS